MQNVNQREGFLEAAVQKTGLGNFIHKLNISKEMLIEIGIYLGIGFVVGFLLKRYSKVFLVLVLLTLSLWFLNHTGIVAITINWQRIQELLFGGEWITITAQTNIGSMLWAWITAHIAAAISFSIGFLAGIRLG